MKKTKAMEVVKYIIKISREQMQSINSQDGTEQSEPLTHLKIQKLLYYIQGLSLVYLDRPIFEDPMEAWRHGPVTGSVYKTLSKFEKNTDLSLKDELDYKENTLNQEEKLVIDIVFQEYGCYTASKLRNMTHEEAPWKDVYQEGVSNIIIPFEKMKEFFKAEQQRKANKLYKQSERFECLFK